MRLLIANKQGLNDHGKLDAAIGQARSFDIAMFQETKLKLTKLNPIRAKWGHDAVYMSACPGQVARRGVLTLFSPRIDVKHILTDQNSTKRANADAYGRNPDAELLFKH